MIRLLNTPVFLLLITGTLIGLNFPLGKIAGDAGVSPIVWALIISLGVAVTSLPVLVVQRTLFQLDATMARYAIISSLVSFIAANLLLFAVIPHVGSGFTGLMFALSPVFTLAFSVLFGLKAPRALGLVGIAIGLAGASLVAWSRQSSGDIENWLWIAAAILIPVTLAVGNVYRSLAWPEGASPDSLAFWSHLFAVVFYIPLLLVFYGEAGQGFGEIAKLTQVPIAAAVQFFVAGLTFPAFFRLQQQGGPVLLSQIGYVAAAVGLVAATVFLGETYRLLTWAGAGVIAVGIAFTIMAQRNKAN